MLHGNGFAWIVRDEETARPQELILLNPETTGVGFQDGKMFYHTRINTDRNTGKLAMPENLVRILPENVLHLKNITHDGLLGYDLITILRECWGAGIAAQRYQSVYFRNNAAPGGVVLKFPQKLDKDLLEHYRNEWNRSYMGLDNAHRTAILANGGEIQQLTVSNEQSQFLQLREHEIATGVASVFGIPPHKLGVPRNTSYNSLEMEERSFLIDTMDAWLISFEEECERKLLKESQRVRDSHFIEFDRRELEQADYNSRAELLLKQLNQGGISYNQYAAEMNLQGIGPDGDRLRVANNLIFLDMIDGDEEEEEPADTQTEEEAAGQVEGQEEPAFGEEGQAPLRSLLKTVLLRFKKRLKKSPRGEHRQVLVEAIAPVCPDPEAVADALLEEWLAVLPEQRERVEIDIEAWTERILKD
jgi:HK97 family phage portal protein